VVACLVNAQDQDPPLVLHSVKIAHFRISGVNNEAMKTTETEFRLRFIARPASIAAQAARVVTRNK
jgi:hypothetical protein